MLESVVREEMPCPPRIGAALFCRVQSLSAEVRTTNLEAHLSRREIEIVELISVGLSNKEIANRLSITLPTVKNHVHSILAKLDVRTRIEAAAWIRQRHLGAV